MSLFVSPVVRATDANVDALSGALWYFYASGGLTPADVYTTSALSTAHANPVVADAGGLFAPIYLDPAVSYRAILKTAAGVTIQDIDPVTLTGAADLSFDPGLSGDQSRSVQAKLRDVVSLFDFMTAAQISDVQAGTVGVDVAAAVQAGIDAAAAAGKELFAPAGTYRLDSQIDCDAGIHIRGEGCFAEVGGTTNEPIGGTWFYLNHTDTGFYCRDDDAVGTSRAFTRFENIGTYRDHDTPAASWTPTSASEDFLIEFRVTLHNVVLLNPYLGVKVRSGGVLWINGLKSQPLFTGIEVERAPDMQNWNDLHFWPFWSQDDNVIGYTLDNAVAVRVRRADGLKINHIFSYGYHRTILAQDVTGDLAGFGDFSIGDLYADKCGGGVEINSDFYNAYGTIAGIRVHSDADVEGTGPAIHISGDVASQINILGLTVTRAHEEALLVEGAAHTVHCQPLKIENWDRLTASHYAFKADDAAIINLLTIPKYGGSSSSLYNQGTNGVINLPGLYRHTYAMASTQGFYSARVTIADDDFETITAPTDDLTVNMMLTPLAAPANGNPAGTYWLRCTGTPSANLIGASHTTNVTLTTGALTGTTGADGDLTISSHSDGKIYIENRTGGEKIFVVTMFGN